jgi:hypothetical protein
VNPQKSPELNEIQSSLKELLDQVAVVNDKASHVTEKIAKTGSDYSTTASDASAEEWKAPTMGILPNIYDTTASMTEDRDNPSMIQKADHDHE